MSFCLRPNVCKKCGKPLTLFEGWTCLECEKAEQEPQCTEQPCLGTLCRYYKEPCRVKNELNIELNELKPCDDAINREDAIRKLRADTLFVCTGDKMQAISDIESLPPVTPSCDKCAMNGSGSKYCDNCGQKSGKWILLDECANSGYYCSECHKKLVKEGWSNTVKKINFCPNCGARMVEPQESEDN